MPPHTTITNLGAVKAQSIAYDATKAAIAIPQVSTADTFTTLGAEQTLTNKTLTTPVIASLKPSSSGGTINMPTVASGSTATLATTTDISSATTNVITTNGEQTLTNKTLTTPIIASLQQSSSGGTINMPTVASGESATLATTDDITSATGNLVTTNTEQTITASKTFTTGSLAFENGMTITANDSTDYLMINYESNDNIHFHRTFPDPDDPTTTTQATILFPETTFGHQLLVTELHPQTLENKTLTTPIIASLKQSGTGGTINMPTVASGESATLATTDDIPSVSNMVTTDTAQNITGVKTFTRTFTNSKGDTVSSVLHIPEHTMNEDYIVTTQLEQTLYNKEIVDPILSVFRKSEFGGFIIVPTVPSGSTVTLLTTVDIPNVSNLVSTDGTQTITGTKTLTSPVLTDGTHTISMPAAANLTANTTFATALDIASLASATDIDRLKLVLSNLLTYLSNWADVGNLNMNDIVSEVDSTNYLGLTAPPS